MRFFILKRKTFHTLTQKKKNTHTHTLRARALITHLLLSSSSSSKERDPLRSPRELLLLPSRSRESVEKRETFLSFFLLVNFCCVIREKGKRDLKNDAFHVGAQPVV